MLIKYLIIAGLITLFFRTLAKSKKVNQQHNQNNSSKKSSTDTFEAEYTVVED